MRSALWLALIAAGTLGNIGCDGRSAAATSDSAGTETGTDPDTAASTDTATTSDTATSTDTPTDTATTTDPPPEQAPVVDVVISQHPTVATVLVVGWRQSEAVEGGWLSFSIDGGEWQTSPEVVLGEGPQEALVLGAPAEVPVEVRIVNRYGDAQVASAETWAATTGSLPVGLEEPTLTSHDPALALDAGFLLTSIHISGGGNTSASWALILDRKGRVVWYRESVDGYRILYPRVARSGDHVVIDNCTYWDWGSNDVSTLRRVTLDDQVLETLTVAGLHHSWDERNDGTILWGAVDDPGGSDELLQATDPDGNTWTVWDSEDWKAEIGQTRGSANSNSVTWVEATDSVVVSFWTNDSAVEFEFATGATLRGFGDWPGSWAFDPPESAFDFQHAVTYTPTGTLLASTHAGGGDREQRIREYMLDESEQTLVEVWSYGEGTGLYAPAAGEASRLDNGNTLLNTGTDPRILEVTADKETVWDLAWGAGRKEVGHMTFIPDLYALDGR